MAKKQKNTNIIEKPFVSDQTQMPPHLQNIQNIDFNKLGQYGYADYLTTPKNPTNYLASWNKAGQNSMLEGTMNEGTFDTRYSLPEFNVQGSIEAPVDKYGHDKSFYGTYKNWDKLTNEEKSKIKTGKFKNKYEQLRLEEKASLDKGEWLKSSGQALKGFAASVPKTAGKILNIPGAMMGELAAQASGQTSNMGNAFDIMGDSQRSVSQVTPTGNPYLDFGLDMFSDPSTYVGSGAVKNLFIKGGGKQLTKEIAKDVPSFISKQADAVPPPFKGSEIDDITKAMEKEVAEKRAWLTSDEYINRRRADTGESKSRILADVDRHLETLEKNADPTVYEFADDTYGYASKEVKMNGDNPIRTSSGNLVTEPSISLNSKYLGTPDFVTAYQHELDHITSPMFYPSRGSIEKTYPALPLKPTWGETLIGKVFPGLKGKYSKRLEYLKEPIEQQARFNELNSLIREDLGLGKIYRDAPKLEIKDIDKYFGDNPVEILNKLDKKGYSDISALLEENMKYIRGRNKNPFASNPENVAKFKGELLDVLNRAWAIPGVIGAGYTLSEDNQDIKKYAMGGYTNPNFSTENKTLQFGYGGNINNSLNNMINNSNTDNRETRKEKKEKQKGLPYYGRSYHLGYDPETNDPMKYATFGDKLYDVFHKNPRVKSDFTQFAMGGPTNPPIKTNNPNDPRLIEENKDGMMKARMAYEEMHGNPAAKRMIAPTDNPYQFENGDTGTHYMGSYDNYAIPNIQDDNGILKMTGPRSNEEMRFDSPEDAEYFAKNYKNVAPAFRAMGGVATPQYEAEGGEVVDGGIPTAFNGGNLTKNSSNAVKINGNSHAQGGVDMAGGKRVFSDRLTVDANFLKGLEL